MQTHAHTHAHTNIHMKTRTHTLTHAHLHAANTVWSGSSRAGILESTSMPAHTHAHTQAHKHTIHTRTPTCTHTRAHTRTPSLAAANTVWSGSSRAGILESTSKPAASTAAATEGGTGTRTCIDTHKHTQKY